ncbi:replication initiation protein [Campylobacter jejuni]|nr:replication initiation protein [Campylobacter jejuni]
MRKIQRLKMAKNTDIVELKEGFTRNQSNVSNAIANARTKMTALELKTFYQVSTLIQMDDTEFKEYEISVSDFLKALNISDSNREQVVKLCRRLIRQVFEINQENDDYIAYTIFSRMHYKHKEQKISMKFNEEFRPFLLELKQFTKIQQVKYIKSFDSKYSIRFYALFKDYRKMSQRDFNLENIFNIFELPKTYNYTRFYQYVLKPAIDEINAKSDLWVSEPEIIGKKGKKITDIRLYFGNQNEKMSDDFIKELIKQYNKFKSFNVFANCRYLADSFNTINDLMKITRISTEKNTYFRAYHSNSFGEESCIIGTPNKDDFLNSLANGIYRAINLIYEKEKKEQLPTMQWQDEKDKLKRFKSILKEWQENPEAKIY